MDQSQTVSTKERESDLSSCYETERLCFLLCVSVSDTVKKNKNNTSETVSVSELLQLPSFQINSCASKKFFFSKENITEDYH